MTDETLKAKLTFLSKQKTWNILDPKPRQLIKKTKVGFIIDRDCAFTRLHFTNTAFNKGKMHIDFEKKTVKVHYWHQDGWRDQSKDNHNNFWKDFLWESLSDTAFTKALDKAFNEEVRRKAWEYIVDDYAKVLTDKILESGGEYER